MKKTIKNMKKTIKNDKKILRGLEKITEFTRIVIASGYLLNEKPLSMVLKAPVSSGKTTAIKQFRNNSNILITTDTTAYGVLSKYQDKLRSGDLTHIIIPDLLNALVRKKSTVETFLLFINASSEDGIFASKNFSVEVNTYIPPFGWILCLTEDAYKRKRNMLQGIGFESRFLIVSHKYNSEMIQNILQDIIKETTFCIPNIKIKHYKIKKAILGNEKIFGELELYSKLLCKSDGPEMLRMQRKLQTFLKASALLRGDKRVNEKDLEKLKEVIEVLQEK